MAISPDGRILALGASGLELWDHDRGLLLRRLGEPSLRFQSLAFSPDGRSLLARADSGFTRWNVASGALEEEIKGFQPLGKHPAFRPVEAGLLALNKAGWAHHQYGFLKILDPDFKVLAQTQGPGQAGYDLPFAASPDGRILAVGAGSQIELWQVSPLRRLGVLKGHPSPITVLSFTPEGRLLSVGFDGVLRVWENPETLVARNPQ
jgi:WD40 repeat protein